MLSAPRKNKKRFYKAKKYSNPFFKKDQHRRSGFFSLKFFKFSFFVLVIGLAWVMFFSQYFIIKNIQINGEGSHNEEINTLAQKQLEKKLFFIFDQKNILFFDTKELKQTLDENYFFDELIVDKDYPGVISVNFKEKNYSLIWLEGEKYYFVSSNGSIIKEMATSTEDMVVFPIIENKANKSIEGKTVVNKEKEISYAIDLFEKLKNQEGFVVSRFVIDNEINTLKVATNSKTVIYFNIEDDIDGQIAKLTTVIKEKIKDSFGNQEYIDLRYGDRVYYK